jgi:hypothetical protein
MINFGDIISKGNDGRVVMLSYPHDSDMDRYEHKDEFGLGLSPHCLFRFLPRIGYVSSALKDSNLISNLGDLLKPKQFVRHKYHVIKTLYGLEELLASLKDLVKSKIFSLKKDLMFFGSSSESFKIIFEAFIESEANYGDWEKLEKQNKTIVLFTPFVYMREHYNDMHIRPESWLRMLLEFLEQMQLTHVKIRLYGVMKNLIVDEEWECISKFSNYLDIHYMDDLSPECLQEYMSNLVREEDSQLFIMFSFNVVNSANFWGKSFANFNSIFDNKACMSLFRTLALSHNTKVLSFYDFNPQLEDYTSGVFYSTLVFEYLSKKFEFNLY